MKGDTTMSNSKYFFSMARARAFAANLEGTDAENITISAFRDAFGQTQYVVKWYLYKEV